METSTVIFISLVLLCGVGDVHAGRRKRLQVEIQAMKGTIVDLETKMINNFRMSELSLKEELTNTFIPGLIKRLVKQAITDILKEGYIGSIISGHVLDEVNSLKVSVNNTKTQLQAVTQQLRHVERERDTNRECLGELRGALTNDIQSLQLQLNETVAELHDVKMINTALRKDMMTLNASCVVKEEIKESDVNGRLLTTPSLSQASFTTSPTTFPGAAGASSDPSQDTSQRERIPQLPVTTQKTPSQVSSDPSQDPIQSERVPLLPETTRKPASQATPSPADCPDLYHASRRGNLEEVGRILSTGDVGINCRWWGRTPLMEAAVKGHREVVELLVSKGADVSLKGDYRHNLLHFASRGGDVETVKFVLSLNVADINRRGRYSKTPLMWAAWGGHREVVELLVSKGADVSLVGDNGNNLLHYACRGGDVEMVKFVLSQNVSDIDSRGQGSRTPVMEAARYGRREVVELLVSKGADVSLVGDYGTNLLHFASQSRDVETVKFVLSLNVVDIDARNNDGQTAADLARFWRLQRVLNLLVSRGAQ